MLVQGAPLAYTPFCDNNKDMDGFRFWKQGFWKEHLRGRPYHISALYVVDLARFRCALHILPGLSHSAGSICLYYMQPSWHGSTWELSSFLLVPDKGGSTASDCLSLHNRTCLPFHLCRAMA